jgi:hypothetical protein
MAKEFFLRLPNVLELNKKYQFCMNERKCFNLKMLKVYGLLTTQQAVF